MNDKLHQTLAHHDLLAEERHVERMEQAKKLDGSKNLAIGAVF